MNPNNDKSSKSSNKSNKTDLSLNTSANSKPSTNKTPKSEPLTTKTKDSSVKKETPNSANKSEPKSDPKSDPKSQPKSDPKSQPISEQKNKTNLVQKHYNRDVWHVTSTTAKSKIESKVKELEKISSEILANGELAHKESEIHKYLCAILTKLDCKVHSSYIYPTAFKAIYSSSSTSDGEQEVMPTVGLICEYDAVGSDVVGRVGIGSHSRGNNLVTEATIAAFIGVREAMKADTRLVGNIVILGTPASEEAGGKIQMMKNGAFDKIDVIVAISPSNYNCLFPKFYCSQKIFVNFLGTAVHMDCINLGDSHNAVNAAVLCYTASMALSNQIQPNCQIHCAFKKTSNSDYLVPKRSELVFTIRAPTFDQLDILNRRVVDCGESAAQATQTQVEFVFSDDDMYSHVNHNRKLAEVFNEEATKMGLKFHSKPLATDLSHKVTDLGNVSHKIPVICPTFAISANDTSPVHSEDFAKTVSKAETQINTINISVVMSLTIIKYLLNPKLREDIKNQFQTDVKMLAKMIQKD